MTDSTSAKPSSTATPTTRAGLIAVALAIVMAVVVLAFTWPAVTSTPRDLPVAIAGPETSVEQVQQVLSEQSDGVIRLHRVDDRSAAIEAIERREVYGAVVLGDAVSTGSPAEATPEVLIATAANATIAQTLTGLATELQKQVDARVRAAVEEQLSAIQKRLTTLSSGQTPSVSAAPEGQSDATDVFTIPVLTVTVTDIVPLAETDPRGTGLTSAMFPLVLGGMLGGIGISLLIIGALRRVIAMLLYAASGGVLFAGILQGWYGALQGNFWLNAAAVAITLAATAAPITGLVALLGRTGIAVGAAVFVLVANPISAATVPVEFLATPWGAIGQWLPPGAAATLLRELSYFPAADTTFPWLILTAWAAGGIILSLIGHLRTTEPAKT